MVISDDILKILELVPFSVKINSLLFDAKICNNCFSSILIRGHAETRSDLMDFIGSLSSSNYFEAIESPVSNLLDERDVYFSITIELKNEP